MNRHLLPYIQIFMNSLVQPMTRQFKGFFRVLWRFPYRQFQKLSMKLSTLTRKRETSLKDYVAFRNTYIAKRVFLLALILLIAVFFLGNSYVKGELRIYSRLYTTDPTNYSGNAKVFDNRDNKLLVYKGEMKEGIYSGKGSRYYASKEKTLEYKGDFDNNMANGMGTAYTKEGKKLYQGAFVNDHYEGQGILYYNDQRTVKYQGEFKNSEYNGIGKIYSSEGALLYSGEFLNGTYNGKGKEYHANGKLKYEGEFATGKYSGAGTLYTARGALQYNGAFADGLFEGTGEKYTVSGAVTLNGTFHKGLAEGPGTEFYPSSRIKYKGEFKSDHYEGAGAGFYDNENNTPKYEGTYKNGIYAGVGKLYDKDNMLVYEGEFAGGSYSGYGIEYKDTAILYTGDFEKGRYNGFGSIFTEEELPLYIGFFKGGKPYPQGYLGITETVLKEKLGIPKTTVLDKEGYLNHTYEAPITLFRVRRNDKETHLTVFDLYIYDTTEILGTNISMTASEVEKLLGKPDSKYSGPIDLEHLPEDAQANYTAAQTVTYLIYKMPGYQLIMPFTDYETAMLYIELKQK